ncbi:hypothetical protein [Sedimenticola hydrogenitrophicus]|uniref:hypothetical protein n=1 Tax=Sedimenticola hydrogenitrophicus TaxID=2967975 RepID=UPI0023B07802|nr:hypothetical protein [Sedimenticola hydrogenitrophicus]
MKKRLLVALLLISVALANSAFAADDHSHGHDSQGVETGLSGLSLNNDQPWEMDEHTRNMSKKMHDTFITGDHSSLEGLTSVGVQLERQMETLIKGCTMTGEAHDQLHLFLNSHIPTINALAKADNYNSARENAIRLKGQLEAYQKHFR